jgi:hypothetical protein
MTDAELLAFADAYFAAHLDAAYWAGLPEGTRTAALAMAVRDLGADPAIEGEARAVCEQAVYLARNHDAQTRGRVVVGQSIEGMSQTFALIGDAGDIGIAPRARQLMRLARGRTVALGRG